MGMSIDEAIEIISDIDKAYRTFSNMEYEAMQKSIDVMRKYQQIFDKYEMLCDSLVSLDGETISKKVDEFCIETMRGLLGEYYAERIYRAESEG